MSGFLQAAALVALGFAVVAALVGMGLWFGAVLHRVSRDYPPVPPDEPRELRVVGWGGTSRPMYRYADEMHLPDSQRANVDPADLPEDADGAPGGRR